MDGSVPLLKGRVDHENVAGEPPALAGKGGGNAPLEELKTKGARAIRP